MWLLLLIPFFSSTVFAQNAAAEARLNKLNELSQNGGNVLDFDSQNFARFNQRFPRQYALLVLLTARDSKYQCTSCINAEENLKKIAKSYNQSKKLIPNAEPLFFVVIDVEKARQVFSENKIETVPMLSYQPYQERSDGGKLKSLQHLPDSNDEILKFIERHHQVKIPKPIDTHRAMQIGGLISILIALISTLAVENKEFIKNIPWNRNLWLFVTMAVYFCGSGGMVYCIINSTPAFMYQSKGQYSFLHQQGRSQFVYEGLIVGMIYLSCALSLIGMYNFASGDKSKINNNSPYFIKRFASYLGNSLRLSLLLSLFIYFFLMLLETYTSKTRWYSTWNLLPDTVKNVFEGSLKGNTIISWCRRFIKLSRHYLYDYSSWSLFQAKAYRLLKLKNLFE